MTTYQTPLMEVSCVSGHVLSGHPHSCSLQLPFMSHCVLDTRDIVNNLVTSLIQWIPSLFIQDSF